MNESREESLARWRGLMDETVAEVFATMLGCECVPAESGAALQDTTAKVRYSGALVGECVLLLAAMDATKLAERFLGGEADEAMAADAVGELCNVVAGGWKRRLRPPASGAQLSVPEVARGLLQTDAGSSPEGRQNYALAGAQFAVDLAIDSAIEE